MDIKLKNNKSNRIILFITIMMSLSLILTSFTIYHEYKGEFYKSKDFYTSDKFYRYIYEKYRKMHSVVDDEYVHQDAIEIVGNLVKERNIKFMAVNNINNKIYTNTEYSNISDFKDSEKGYVEIEGKNYKLNMNVNGKNTFKEVTLEPNANEARDISIYAILPEKLEYDDALESIYNDYMTRYNMRGIMYSIGVIGLIMCISSIVIAKKIGYKGIDKENKIYIMYSRIALELKIIAVIAIMLIDRVSNFYINYTNWGEHILKLEPIALIGSILLKAVYLIMIYMLIKEVQYRDIFKNSIIGKFNKAIKNKNILTIFMTIIAINIVIYIILSIILNIFLGGFYNLKAFIMSMVIFISFIAFTACIISNLSNLSSLAKSVKMAIKKMLLIKKILLIFITIVIINISTFIIILIMGASIGDAATITIVSGAISFILFTTYIIASLGYLNEIMEGVKKIESGDINYKIEVKGNDSFTVLAEKINGIGNGLDNAIEERMKSEKMKSELITNVSHDLKTPLTSILNYVDLLKKEEVKPEYLNDYIAILDQKSKRLKILIEDLFEAAKATSGSVELNIEKIQLNQLLTQSIAEMEGKLKEAELDIKFNFPENKVYINADGKKLFRVFENLISNIVKYSLKGTRVYVDMNYDDEYAYVNFKNISAYELNFDEGEIIERFKRGDISRSEEGSGLGLSIAKGLVELQGGEFNIQTDGDLFKAIVKLKISKE